MEEKEIVALVKKYQEGTLTPDEKALLDSWYAHYAQTSPVTISDSEVRESLQRISRGVAARKQPLRRKLWVPLAGVAAGLALCLGIGYYFFGLKADRTATDEGRTALVIPGKNRAILTLADGRTIALDSAQSGIIVAGKAIKYENGNSVLTEKGQVVERLPYNSVETPRGGQYQVMLSDGTRVWLNAQSTLRYPSEFTKGERVVQLDGEGFFDVARQDGRPFKVRCGNQEIQVLATAFNVRAYSDEQAIKTTLVEGKVKVSAHDQSIVLKPGFETSLSKKELNVYKANLKTAVSWKSGMFYFDHADLKTVMDQVKRWYDVEVVYQTARSGDEFMGTIPRSSPLDRVLEILRLSGVEFSLEGRKLIVSD